MVLELLKALFDFDNTTEFLWKMQKDCCIRGNLYSVWKDIHLK